MHLAESIQCECDKFSKRHILEDPDTDKPNINHTLAKYESYLNAIIEDLKNKDPLIFFTSPEENEMPSNKK